MKMPKLTHRYCRYCKKHTECKVSQYKTGGKRGALTHGAIPRARKRGLGRGFGNRGKWGSKPAISKFKRTGAKSSKKTTLQYTCQVCKKITQQSQGFRAKKMELV